MEIYKYTLVYGYHWGIFHIIYIILVKMEKVICIKTLVMTPSMEIAFIEGKIYETEKFNNVYLFKRNEWRNTYHTMNFVFFHEYFKLRSVIKFGR